MTRFILVFFLAFSLNTLAIAESNLIDKVQQVENSVVEVKTELVKVMNTESDLRKRVVTFERTAAGLIIDPRGIIVTNTHTIVHAPFIFIILKDGTRLPAELLYVSPTYDFSFLLVHPPHPLKPIKWADSSTIALEQPIVAIGNSSFNEQALLGGKIKSIFQSITTKDNEFLELDIDLYHGDSGGPILDYNGRLVGIIMAKAKSEERRSFALAVNKIHEQYLQYKYKAQLP